MLRAFCLLLLVALPGRAQTTQAALPDLSSATFRVQPRRTEPEKFHWKAAFEDAGIFLAIEHSFRLAEDPQVRGALHGSFLGDYAASVKAIHGWNDGDPFVVNYIGHPNEGAVAGYIEIHNDPRYRSAEFGDGGRYWKSRLRGMAFAAAYSLQFEIGPVSEASIGNSQLQPHATGVVDWVVTPTVGTLWVIGEDMTDKYVIQAIERHTRNPAIMAMARTFLNPAHGFSNIVARVPPWTRDDRAGVIFLSHQPR